MRGTLVLPSMTCMVYGAAAAGKEVLRKCCDSEGQPRYAGSDERYQRNGALPTHNHRDVQFEGATISPLKPWQSHVSQTVSKLATNQARFGCTIACRVSTIDRNHFSVKDRPEYHKARAASNTRRRGPRCGDRR